MISGSEEEDDSINIGKIDNTLNEQNGMETFYSTVLMFKIVFSLYIVDH